MKPFSVLVRDARRARWLRYPPADGSAALRAMQTLAARGHHVLAETADGDFLERLTLGQMTEICADFDATTNSRIMPH